MQKIEPQIKLDALLWQKFHCLLLLLGYNRGHVAYIKYVFIALLRVGIAITLRTLFYSWVNRK